LLAQKRPEVRPLGAVTATARGFAMVGAVRSLSDGSVLVNDPMGRRLVLFDSLLVEKVVVADSTAATANAYAQRMGGLLAFRGDSSLFVDPQSFSMLVVDPAGKIARSMAVPRSRDAMQLAGIMGGAGFDPAGALVYRAGFNFAFRGAAGAARAAGTPPGGPPMLPQMPDSAGIIRVNLATRQVDTVGRIKTPTIRLTTTEVNGNTMTRPMVDPLPIVDDWAMLPDGTVAFIRGLEYRVEWVAPDGTRTTGPKIPFDWQRLSDEEKVTFMDSVKVARERLQAEMASRGGDEAAMAGMMGGGGPGGAGPIIVTRQEGARGAPPRDGAAGGTTVTRAQGQGPGGFQMGPLEFINPRDLPDYKPPFFSGAARADPEGNIWIRTIPTRAIPGGPIYDVINRQGELVDRVQVPQGRTIVGFGAGVAYLVSRSEGVTILERARLK
jgi:hypothetical protein